MPAKQVSPPTRSTSSSAGPSTTTLPARRASPQRLVSGTDSPDIMDSSTRQDALSSRPSAGTAPLGNVHTIADLELDDGDRLNGAVGPVALGNHRHRTHQGIAQSQDLWRARISQNLPTSRKKTNMLTESKYTSPPPRMAANRLAA
jgi:hypothetical protein